jgi:biopolymer transport protein ExbD
VSAPFRQRGALHSWQLHFGPNMTPMVDVVMVILIFFMASTALVGPEWLLRVGLAPDDATPAGFDLGPAQLTLALDASGGAVYFTGLGVQVASLEQLDPAARAAAQALGTAIARTRITITAGPTVPYEAVVHAHDRLTAAGFEHVAIR